MVSTGPLISKSSNFFINPLSLLLLFTHKSFSHIIIIIIIIIII